jgi:hypothetical protein
MPVREAPDSRNVLVSVDISIADERALFDLFWHPALKIPKRGWWSDNIGTSHVPLATLKRLASRKLITFSKAESMSSIWGVDYYSIKLADRGKEAIASIPVPY